MMYQGDVGTKCTNGYEFVNISVAPGASLTLKNVSGDTLSYWNNQTSSAAGTLTATNSTTITTPTFVSSAGRTSISIVGTGY